MQFYAINKDFAKEGFRLLQSSGEKRLIMYLCNL